MARTAHRGGAHVAERTPQTPSAVREGSTIGLAVMAGNVMSYLLTLAAIRRLAPDSYGELAALLSVLLVGSVPMTGLQLHVALDVARGVPGAARAGLARGVGVALVVAAVGASGAPLVGGFLSVGDTASLVAVVASLVPLTVAGSLQGVLQGRRSFDRLAVVLLLQGVGKVGGGLLGLAAAPRPATVLVGMAFGAWLATLAGWLVAVGPVAPPRPALDVSRSVVLATVSVAAVLALANVDVVAARHLLAATPAGIYAAGAVLAKITFWAPQAVSVLALPRLADDAARRRVVLASLGVLVAVDGGVVLACAVLWRPIAGTVFGPGYADTGPLVTGFAVLGASWAAVQLLSYGALAAGDVGTAVVLWAGVLVEVTLLAAVRPRTPAGVLGVALAVGCGLGLAAAAVGRLRSGAPGARTALAEAAP